MHEKTNKYEPLQPYDERMKAMDMDPENDFPEITPEVEATARRGFIAGLQGRAAGLVQIDEDLIQLFPTEKAVNEALRKVAELVRQVERRQAS